MNEPLTKEKEIHTAGGSPVLLKKHDVRSAVEGYRTDIDKFYLDNAGILSLEQIDFLIDKWFPVFKEEK